VTESTPPQHPKYETNPKAAEKLGFLAVTAMQEQGIKCASKSVKILP